MRHISSNRRWTFASHTPRPRQYTAYRRPFTTGVRICWTTAGSERAHRGIARPRQTKVAHNFPRSLFENCSKRCNSNAMISNFEVVTGELHAKLVASAAIRQREGAGRSGPDRVTRMHTMNRRCGERRRGRSLAVHHRPRATSVESANGAEAWPGFEPTRRAKLAAQTTAGPDGARNTGGNADRHT